MMVTDRYCEAFVERDNLYIVMEFAEHGDTHRQIKKFKEANKYIKETTIWSYLIQICLGLQELHSRNILHRVSNYAEYCIDVHGQLILLLLFSSSGY